MIAAQTGLFRRFQAPVRGASVFALTIFSAARDSTWEFR